MSLFASFLLLSAPLHAEEIVSTPLQGDVITESSSHEIALMESISLLPSAPSEIALMESIAPLPSAPSDIALMESIAPLPIITSAEQTIEGFPVQIKRTKSPFVAVMLSSLVPGLGHYYLGDVRTGSEILGGVLLSGASTVAARNDFSLFFTGLHTTQAVSWYGSYAAYRDARLYNGNPPARMPRENFKNLSAAPFQWSVIKKPEVWGGFLGALAAGTALIYFTYPEMRTNTYYVQPLSALPIAVGEESLFRGLIQSSLLDSMPPWGAIACSSLAFGAAHIPNAMALEPFERNHYYAVSLPFITGLGAYMGWLTYKNASLKESVALHAWYDFALMCVGVFANQAATRGAPVNIAHSFEF